MISYQKPEHCYHAGVMTSQMRIVHVAGGNGGLCDFG